MKHSSKTVKVGLVLASRAFLTEVSISIAVIDYGKPTWNKALIVGSVHYCC